MSRLPTSTAKPLSLTEELEKLEQSITLTLQEIDHNFSRAHRIVTSSILPIVEQYGEHSTAVWEGSKFWKQFFEASAGVSLSSIGEKDPEEEEVSYAQSHEASTYTTSTSQAEDDTLRTVSEEHASYEQIADSLLDDGDSDISGSTPRARPTTSSSDKAKFADYSSSYEALKQQLKGTGDEENEEDATEIPPTTPGTKSRIPDMSMTPVSSPLGQASYLQSANRQSVKKTGPLLHRVLDKNYVIQQTPHTARKEHRTPANKPSWRDTTSPMSSPPVAAPQLRSEIFSSPIRQQFTKPNGPRTPGVSVNPQPKAGPKNIFGKPVKKDEITWESDSDEDAEGVYRELGMSPPKTIQFSLPQSRLLQTPAREASKRIVEDLLATAGAGFDEESLDDSPSMVVTKEETEYSF